MSNPITPGHTFVRPGQVDPDLPPPDNCVRCGRPESAHRPQLAEAIAARAIVTDYRHLMHEFVTGSTDVDFVVWSLRLSQHLEYLLDAIDRTSSLVVTAVRPDNSATLSYQDLCVTVGALRDAAAMLDAWLPGHKATCKDCAAAIAGTCMVVEATLAAIVQYRALAVRLGDDR